MSGISLFKKGMAVAVILLFIGIAFAPSINANISKASVDSETAEITVSQYKADGTVEKITVVISKEKSLDLAKQFKYTDDPEEQFSLFKEYGLIPEDVTKEKLRNDMLKSAQRLGFTEEKLESLSTKIQRKQMQRIHFVDINFLNEISGFAFFAITFPIGLTPLIILYNLLFSFYPGPTFDIIFTAFNLFICDTYFQNGLLPDFELSYGLFSLVGFVGFVLTIPFLPYPLLIFGNSVATFALGVIRDC